MAFNEERLTDKSSAIVRAAIEYASDRGHVQLEVPHLAHVLLNDSDGLLRPVLAQAAVDVDVFMQCVADALNKIPVQRPLHGMPSPSGALMRVMNDADSKRKKMGDDYLSLDHLILAMFHDKEFAKLVGNSGATILKVEEAIKRLRRGKKVTSRKAEQGFDALNKYAVDLTAQAEQGKLAWALPSRRGEPMWKKENPRRKFWEITGRGHATQGGPMREILVAEASQRGKA